MKLVTLIYRIAHGVIGGGTKGDRMGLGHPLFFLGGPGLSTFECQILPN